ncbi:hypothetical protein E2C01_048373 [Portunus trituberculatus]|uniref:Uncharacterized protein n=1 Tax=Portunus trituberculatus TaxID=210409 RepID=A0A5B7GAD7_PORTR|nr:hypothetical protein [Portunus trituberculatus]
MVSEGRGKPKLVDGNLCKRIEGQNVPLWKLSSQRIYYSQRN